MINANALQKSLESDTDREVYLRALDYSKRNLVRKWSVKEDAVHETIMVTGEVRGTFLYRAMIEFDTKNQAVCAHSCDCPYDDEECCKHSIALGLAYIQSLENNKTKETDSKMQVENTDEMSIRQALEGLGFSVDQFPRSLLDQLLQYKTSKSKNNLAPAAVPPSTIPTESIQPLQQPLQPNWVIPSASDSQNRQKLIDAPKKPRDIFDPKKYFISLEQYRGYAPDLYESGNPLQQVSVARILKRKDLSEPQRKLLENIKASRSNYYTLPPTDLSILFPLIMESGFPVRDNHYSFSTRKISIVLNPPKLKAELVYEPFENQYMETVTHNFYVRMPEEYWKENKRDWRYEGKNFTHSGSCIVRDTGKTLELYRLTPLLAGVISRVHEQSHRTSFDKYMDICQTRLKGEEIAKWNELTSDMKNHLDLTAPLPDLTLHKYDTCQPSIAVNFDAIAHSIKVRPVIDYGTHLQDVSESIYEARRRSGRELIWRQPYGHTDTHAVVVKDREIQCAPFTRDKEKELYRDLSGQIDESTQTNKLGFTKTLKYSKEGAAKVNSYISDFWPKLQEYVESKGYPIIFEKDKIESTEQSFRAEFSADLNADNDWLYFDVNCYCGSDRVTLDKLYEFIESGEQFWRSDDGKLIKIKNRADLERLVRLLKSFHAKQQGFEGSMRQAAELEYVMTSSPYYEAERAKSFKKFMSFMDKGKPIKPVRLPASFNRVMRPYQKSGVEWLYFLRSYRFGGILADDMGLGKTLQALATWCLCIGPLLHRLP